MIHSCRITDNPMLRRCARHGLLLWAALAILWTAPALHADCPLEQLQKVSGQTYYTLFFSSGQHGVPAGQPLMRVIRLTRFRNHGSTCVHTIETGELPFHPYLEFRSSVNGQPVPVQKIFWSYLTDVTFPAGQEVETREDALLQVLPKDPQGKIDFFEDGIQATCWRLPIENIWVVVDLGKMYDSFRQGGALGQIPSGPGQTPAFGERPPVISRTPAFGLSSTPLRSSPPIIDPRSTPLPTFPQFLTSQMVQLLPAGYRIQGNTLWWHWKQISDPGWGDRNTLHVEWRAWYR